MENSRIRSLIDHRLNVMSQSRRPAVASTFPSGAPKPKLLDRVRLAIRTHHYSYKTEEAYVGWVKVLRVQGSACAMRRAPNKRLKRTTGKPAA